VGKYPDKSGVARGSFCIFVYVNQQAEHSRQETVTLLKDEYDSLLQTATEFKQLTSQYEDLKHQLAELKRLIVGSRSEKHLASVDAQLALFEQQAAEPSVEVQAISYNRRKSVDKKQPVRTELPAHLPRLVEVIEPDPFPEGASKIGEEISESLEYKPASVYVRQVIRPKYAVKDQGVVCAAMPTMPIPKSNAGASLLAHLIVSKFVDHLPFYRKSKMFQRQGISLAESTISGWFAKSCDLLEPLYEQMKKQLLTSGYIQADETPIKVLDPAKKKATHRGYHWVITIR
jgi:transposase